MKLVELECQNCGAALKVEEGTNNVTCPYCKATYKLDDEVQHVKYDDMENSGYEFEKGRIKAQKEHASSNVNANVNSSMNTNMNTNVNSKFPKVALIPFVIVAIVMIVSIVTSGLIFKDTKNKFDNKSNSAATEKAKKELESKVYDFNWRYSSGKKAGAFVKDDLNDVINSNRTNKERFITVKFNGIETQDSDEILKIIDQIDSFKDYNVLLDYDNDGFITVINIE